MSEINGSYFQPDSTACLRLGVRQSERVIEFLEDEMEEVERGPQTDDYMNLWRRVAALKANSDRLRRRNDAQIVAFELEARRARGLKAAA